jgi:hypothetical protein
MWHAESEDGGYMCESETSVDFSGLQYVILQQAEVFVFFCIPNLRIKHQFKNFLNNFLFYFYFDLVNCLYFAGALCKQEMSS